MAARLRLQILRRRMPVYVKRFRIGRLALCSQPSDLITQFGGELRSNYPNIVNAALIICAAAVRSHVNQVFEDLNSLLPYPAHRWLFGILRKILL
jgi:hypothetical protein